MSKEKMLKLEVAESLQEDIDKGIARIPSSVMRGIGIVSGDIIEIKGKTRGVVRALRAMSRDNGGEIIRIDGTIRSNIGASIGDSVEIKVVKIEGADSITLAPLQEVRFSDDPTEYFHSKLLDIPIALNQKIVIDVFGTRLGYVVSKVNPKGYAIVSPGTRIIVSESVHAGDLKATGISSGTLPVSNPAARRR